MKIQFILFILSAGLLFSCNKKDDFDGTVEVFAPPQFSDSTPQQSKVKQMFNTYGVIFKPVFTEAEYSWNWTNTIRQTSATEAGYRYTPAKENYIVPVIDSVESWVFKVLGEAFTKKYMPLNILMTDTMENKFEPSGGIVHRIFEGNIAVNYILISYVSERFDEQKTKRLLRESWLSLFIEKVLPKLPALPPAFLLSAPKDISKADLPILQTWWPGMPC